MIGAGILRQPGVVAGALGEPFLIVSFWVAGAIMAAVNAFTVVELGASLPRAGGPYALVAHALGDRPGALIGWADWMNGMSTLAFLAVAFAEFAGRAGLLPGRSPGLLAVALLLVAFLLNWQGTRTNGAFQTGLCAAKGIALALILVAVLLAPAAPPPPAADAPHAALSLAAIALAFRAIHNCYTGYQTPIYVGEEMQAPERNVARAVFGGLGVVAVLYVLINIALLRALEVEAMAASPIPLAEGAQAAFGPAAGLAVAAFGALSVAASVNLRLMTHSRGAFAMARDRVLPAALAHVAPGGAPRVALLLTFLGAVGLAGSGAYLALVAINAPLRILIEIALVLSLVRLRQTAPDLPRPFRMPLYPLPALIALLGNTALLVAVVLEDPANSGIALAAVAAAALFIWWRR